MYFDTHCHLNFAEFDQILERSMAQWHEIGVRDFLIPATKPSTWDEILQLSQQLNLYCSIGIHPYFIGELCAQGFSIEAVSEMLVGYIEKHHQQINGIGEFGLDNRKEYLHPWQEPLFDLHLLLATQVKKPVILHSVKAHQKVLERIKKQTGSLTGIVHGFSGSYEQAKQFVDLGLHIGVGGVISKPTAYKTRNAISKLPLDSLVLETDSPDMPLFNQTQTFNTPANIPVIFHYLAQIRSENLSILEDKIYKNSVQLFE